MKRFFNPFLYIAGTKSLVWGVIFIISEAVLFYGSGSMVDGFIHITPKSAGVLLWQTALIQILLWLLPALVLYGCGVVMSRSRIRIVDILGTTAFSWLLLLPMAAPCLVPSLSLSLQSVADTVVAGSAESVPLPSMLLLMAAGMWSMVWYVLFCVWNCNAFATSCNLRGAKAIAVYVAVVLTFALCSPYAIAAFVSAA